MRTAGLMPPSTDDVADARHGAQPLRHQRVGEVGQLAQRDGGRGQRQRDDRRVGRVHLGVGRRIGQVARQRRAGGVDGRLHVLRGGIDVAVEHELQRDLADAVGRRRRHGGERRDLPELALERRRHQVGRRLGVGARQLRRHLDGREIDLRQRRDRQPANSRARRPAVTAKPSSEVAIGRRMKGDGDAHCVELPSALRASASRGLPPLRAAAAALQASESLRGVGLQAGAHASPRSTPGQSFCMSAAQAVRILTRASDLAAAVARLSASAPAVGCSSGVGDGDARAVLEAGKSVVTTRSAAAMPLAIDGRRSRSACATVIGPQGDALSSACTT